MFVSTTSRLPCVELTTTSTSTDAPIAPAAAAATKPSSQRLVLNVETRRRSRSTIPTYRSGEKARYARAAADGNGGFPSYQESERMSAHVVASRGPPKPEQD